MNKIIPDNLTSLYSHEEFLRENALKIIKDNQRLKLHLAVIESAMNHAELLLHFETSDEDLKVVKMLGMSTFNAFAASLKLAFSGYYQNSALVMRGILETAFLLDLFQSDRSAIARWRFADDKTKKKEFSPFKVRDALDKRDGNTSKKRAEKYEMFSILAGHPNMNSILMMRPKKDSDAVIGPFTGEGVLEATLDELGSLAAQIGESLDAFFPTDWEHDQADRLYFNRIKSGWFSTFYPKSKTA